MQDTSQRQKMGIIGGLGPAHEEKGTQDTSRVHGCLLRWGWLREEGRGRCTHVSSIQGNGRTSSCTDQSGVQGELWASRKCLGSPGDSKPLQGGSHAFIPESPAQSRGTVNTDTVNIFQESGRHFLSGKGWKRDIFACALNSVS